MSSIFRTYRLPLAITLVTAVVLAWWTWRDRQDFGSHFADKERHRSVVFCRMLAGGIHAMEESGRLKPEEIQGIVDSIINSSHYRFFVLEQNGRRIYQTGRIPATLTLPSTETAHTAGDLYVVSHRVNPLKGNAGNNDEDSDDGDQGATGTVPDRDEYLMILGGGLQHTRHELSLMHTVVRIGATLLFLLAGVATWHMVVRNRVLAEQLKMERAHSAHLEELGLAAAGLAHETKNPLGIISGIAQQIISDPKIPERSRVLIDAIIDEVDKSASRLGHFMTFARQRKTDATRVEIKQLCDGIAEVLQSEFDAAKVALEVSGPSMTVLADEDMLRQILVNLLLNSLQASSEGGRVEVDLVRRGERATLKVTDRGCGISQDLLPNIFKPYVVGKPDGHGLGLAIVKRFVEDHGWTIDVETQLDRGTVVGISGILLVRDSVG